MHDYLGIQIEGGIKEKIRLHHPNAFDHIIPLIKEGWETTQNASFKVWELLCMGKEKEAIEYRKDHVMARDNSISLYICQQKGLNRAFDKTLNCCLTTMEKEDLLKETLILSCEICDLELATKILELAPQIIDYKNQHTATLALEAATKSESLDLVDFLCKKGLDPSTNKDQTLKIAIELENCELIEYFLKTSDFRNIDYFYLDKNLCQKAKTKSFVTLLSKGVYLEGNNHQLLRCIDGAIKELRPESHRKEMQKIMCVYPQISLGSLEKHKNKYLSLLASKEIARREATKISDKINKKFQNELAI